MHRCTHATDFFQRVETPEGLVEVLLLDVDPERLDRRRARRLAGDAGDLRQGRGARDRLEETLAGLLLSRRALLARRLGCSSTTRAPKVQRSFNIYRACNAACT